MMGSSEIFPRRRDSPAPAPEMKGSAFARTCSRFSHFLKERRSLGGYNGNFPNMAAAAAASSSHLDIKGGNEEYRTTMNLFPKSSTENISEGNISSRMENFDLNHIPLVTSSAAIHNEDSTQNMTDMREFPRSKEEQPKTSRPTMTIFYGGKVLVFDEMPEAKAQEIMALASQTQTQTRTQIPTTQISDIPSNTQIQTQTQTQTQIQTTQISDSPSNTQIQTQTQTQTTTIPQVPANSSDKIPIARRSSLHRFMEKRKDRISATAPYQVVGHNLCRQSQPQQHELELKL